MQHLKELQLEEMFSASIQKSVLLVMCNTPIWSLFSEYEGVLTTQMHNLVTLLTG
jgi:hypothetical protein